jgi:phenylalanyl-tRNA synthetase beta chain
MHEIEGYVWFDDIWLSTIGYNPGRTLQLRNPVAPEKARLRTTLLPHLLRVVQDNLDHADDFAVFEIGHVFVPGEAPDRRSSDSGHSEQQRLAAATVVHQRSGVGEAEQFRRVVAALEDLGRTVTGKALRMSPASMTATVPWQAPGSWATVLLEGAAVGTVGLLPAGPRDLVAGGRQVVWFELDVELLEQPRTVAVEYQPIPAVPGSRQDFAVLWPADRPYAELEAIVAGFRHKLCTQWRLVDVFSGDPLPADRSSYTFRFWLQDPAVTLVAADILGFRAQMLAHLEQYGLSLR